MFTKNTAVMWFRLDLRLEDNPALFFALQSNYEVIPIYIIEEEDCSDDKKMRTASKAWLYHALKNLNHDLNGRLQVFYGKREKIIFDIFLKTNAKALFYNKIHEPWEILRDANLSNIIDSEASIFSFNASLIVEPGGIKNLEGDFYKIFTPFYKRFYLEKIFTQPLPKPKNLVFSDEKLNDIEGIVDIDTIDLAKYGKLSSIAMWEVGEKPAKNILESFAKNSIQTYNTDRDFPSIDGTSKLAPYLHFGHISARYIWHTLQKNTVKESFLRQLAWREFAYYTLYHHNNMWHECINAKYENFPWTYNENLFEAWKNGVTGYPMVDAGMRELLQTGYMHNRVRMIVASFLVKNLNIHWVFGERWFRENLFDADIANNSFGWQWVAGCGTDAAPYFRIFNPTLQAQKFDSCGDYIRAFVPELASISDKYLFEPWAAPKAILEQKNVFLGKNYPFPIINFKESRVWALDLYKIFTKGYSY